jgi:hypothetical protein
MYEEIANDVSNDWARPGCVFCHVDMGGLSHGEPVGTFESRFAPDLGDDSFADIIEQAWPLNPRPKPTFCTTAARGTAHSFVDELDA